MKTKYKDFIKKLRDSDEYWAESIKSDFTEELCRLMSEQDISRTELAERIGAKPSYITKILRGNANFTLVSMTKLARALGAIVRVHLAPKNATVEWQDKFESADIEVNFRAFHAPNISTLGKVTPSRVEHDMPSRDGNRATGIHISN